MNIDTINIAYALGIGCTVGAVAGYVGSLMVTKRMALTGGALGHLTLPGITLALHFNFDISLGALIFLTIGIILIWLLQQTTNLPVEAIIAVIFSSSLAISFLFLPEKEVRRALLGDIASLDFTIFIITLICTAIIFIVISFLYKKITLISISPALAHVEGINIRLVQFIYLSFIALTIALGVRIIGGLMTAALVAIPASSSKLLAHNLKIYRYLSLVLGGIASILGVSLSLLTSLPVGPLIIIVSAGIFILCFFLRAYPKNRL